VAAALQRRGIRFEMSLYGSGALEGALREQIAAEGLEGRVRLEGLLEFHRELMPRLRDTVDLFACCHPQGDPSCTYLETMAAGVPMVGYENESFAGLMRRGPIGWGVPIGQVEAMADVIARLDRDRGELAERAEAALAFAREHTFEATFARRVAHLREVAEAA
jgi:glycosyltransferase involved in cell wall biosynthesis